MPSAAKYLPVLALCAVWLHRGARAEVFLMDPAIRPRAETCPPRVNESPLACQWSPASCLNCEEQCNINQGLLELDFPNMAENRRIQEQLMVCYAAGSLSLLLSQIQSFETTAAPAARRLATVDGLAQRGLLQDTSLSQACPSDAVFDALTALTAGVTAGAAAEAAGADAVVRAYLSNPTALRAYVAANCSTYAVEAADISELGLADASVQGSVEICSANGAVYRKVLTMQSACSPLRLTDVGNDRCFEDTNAAYYMSEGCLTAASDLLGFGEGVAARFARAAAAVHANCRRRTTAETCQSAAADQEMSSELEALRSSQTDIMNAAPRTRATLAAAAAALFATVAVLL